MISDPGRDLAYYPNTRAGLFPSKTTEQEGKTKGKESAELSRSMDALDHFIPCVGSEWRDERTPTVRSNSCNIA